MSESKSLNLGRIMDIIFIITSIIFNISGIVVLITFGILIGCLIYMYLG